MRILRVLFILGFFPLEYCVVAPHPVLDCGYTEIGALTLFIGAALIILTGDREGLGARHIFLSILPWLIAGLFVANWALDRSDEIRHDTTVVDIHFGRSFSRVIVHSGRPGRSTEEICLKDTIYFLRAPRFIVAPGDPIAISVKGGALGMPWVTRMSPSPYQAHEERASPNSVKIYATK